MKVAILDQTASYRQALADELVKLGLEVDEARSLRAFLQRRGSLMVVATVSSLGDWRRVRREAGDPGLVVALSTELDPALWAKILTDGAAGVADRRASPAMAAEAVQAAHRGEVRLPIELARRLARAPAEWPPPTVAVSDEERAWLQALSDGMSVRSLHQMAMMSERVLHRRLQNLYIRMGVQNRDQAVKRATQLGIVE